MALLVCPDCGRHVSDTAPACPGCGRLGWQQQQAQHQAPRLQQPATVYAKTPPAAHATQLVGALIAIGSLGGCAAFGGMTGFVMFLFGCLVFGIGRAMA
jgi:hypothetical protein